MTDETHPLLCKCSVCSATLPVIEPEPPPRPANPPPQLTPWTPTRIAKPGRRVKSLSAYIGAKTQNGKEIARFYLDVMRDASCHMNHRMQAAKELLDRSVGKPVERSVMVKIEADSARLDVSSQITDESLAALIRQLGDPGGLARSDNGPSPSGPNLTPRNDSVEGEVVSVGDLASEPSGEE